jgi:hypothetical protein
MMAFSAKQTLPISQTCSQKYRSVDLQLFTASTYSHHKDRGAVRWA